MSKNEEKLRERLHAVRKSNSIGSILVVFALAVVVWLFELFDGRIPIYVSIMLSVFSMPIMWLFYDKVNDAGIVKCPKCGGVVEKGRMIGHKLPESCPHCGLRVLKRHA